MRKFLTVITIVGVVGGAFLGVFAMNHRQDSSMAGDCPLSSLHTSLCPTDVLPMAFHSISMYQAFTNGLVSLSVMQALMATFLSIVVAYVLRRNIISIPYLFVLTRNFRAKLYRPQALVRWLSLLVNSPSLI